MYGLLLPNQCDSPAATKRKKPHTPKSHESHVTTDDITATSDPSMAGGETTVVQLRHSDHLSPPGQSSRREGRRGERERREGERKEGGRREEVRRNRHSVVVRSDKGETGLGGTEVQVLYMYIHVRVHMYLIACVHV